MRWPHRSALSHDPAWDSSLRPNFLASCLVSREGLASSMANSMRALGSLSIKPTVTRAHRHCCSCCSTHMQVCKVHGQPCVLSMQVTQKVPMLANNILQGIPTTLNVKGLELNISLAGAAPHQTACFSCWAAQPACYLLSQQQGACYDWESAYLLPIWELEGSTVCCCQKQRQDGH